jgi:hypothetical protein
MKFTNLVDYTKFICNENLSPGNKVLIAGDHPNINKIKQIIHSILCDCVVIDNNPNKDAIIVNKYLPFEDNIFDLIFDFNGTIDFENILKESGKQFRLI